MFFDGLLLPWRAGEARIFRTALVMILLPQIGGTMKAAGVAIFFLSGCHFGL